MIVIGNLLLAVAGLVFFLFAIELLGKTSPGGDASVGHALAIFMTNAIFLGCIVAVAAIIGGRGGWGWVGSTGGSRFLLVSFGLFLALGGAAFAAFREGLQPFTSVLAFLPALIWPLVIVGLGILLNGGSTRWPLFLAAGLGAIPCGLVLFGTIKNRVELGIAREKARGQPDENDLQMIAEIEAFDSTTHISRLLLFTDFNKDKSVREPALAKIKTYPNWQKQLADGLQTRWAPEVFTFLASAEPDDKTLFAEPIRDGILQQAALIREHLKKVDQRHHLYAGQFGWEVERVVLTVKKYAGNGVDYRPAMQEFRTAFDAPCSIEKPKLGIGELDKWLKKY